jgi:hypothetical protein
MTLRPTCAFTPIERSGLKHCFLKIDNDTVLGYRYTHDNPYVDRHAFALSSSE